ncbi:MAG: hypothetical protein AB7T22_07415 [Calditrichaceae bacterium]
MNTLFYLVVIVAVLFVIQVIALLRMRRIITQLNQLLRSMGVLQKRGLKTNTAVVPKNCNNCKFRQAFIRVNQSYASEDEFYYRCKIHQMEVALNHCCDKFEPDPAVLQ